MSNEEMFNIFATVIGISFFVALAIPVIGILCSIGAFIANLIPERRLSDAEIDRIFGNNFSPEHEMIPVPVRAKATKNNLNTNSPIREYRLPDGSMVAFDTGKVHVSEKSAI